MPSTDSRPRGRVAGLVTRELESGETIVYDRDRDRVHCLNPSATLVWRNCDGTRTTDDLARLLHDEGGLPEDVSLVKLALADLREADLLEAGAGTDALTPPVTRREALGRVGYGAAIAALAPVVVSLLAPEPAAAASCLPAGVRCTADAECCSGNCVAGICAP